MNRSVSIKLNCTPSLAKLCLFFLAFPFLGIQIGSFSLYASFLIICCDLRFWSSLLKKNLSLDTRIFIFGVIFLFGLLAPSLVWGNSAAELIRFVLKCLFAIMIILYFSIAIPKYKQFIVFGVGASVIMAICQFFEAGVLGSQFLAPNGWIRPVPFLSRLGASFPIGQSLGVSYAPGFISNTYRVSGGAVEPGHFSSILFFLLPFLFTKNLSPRTCAWIIGILCSFSKVTAIQILIVLTFAIFRYSPIFFSMIFITSLTLVVRVYVNSIGGLQSFLENYDGSFLERFRGFFLYFELPPLQQVIGTGIQGPCEFLPKELLAISEEAGSIVMSTAYRSVCTAGAHSGISSFILAFGFIGCLSLLFSIWISFKRSQIDTRKRKAFFLLCFIAGFQSVYFFTLWPALLACVAGFLVEIETENCDLPNSRSLCQ